MKKIFSQSWFVILFALVISIPLILPYFHKEYFPTHDGEWAVVRMGDMFRTLRDQQFPVRYSGYLNFGYGYPLFNFAYPGPYYLGMGFHFLKIGFIDSVKLLFVASVVLSALTMYLASKEIWKNKIAALISALFYLYFPYRIIDLYARGSLGESLSFALFPLIFFFSSKIIDDHKTNRYIILGAVTYAFLITTHNIMTVLFTPVLLIFIVSKMIFTHKKIKEYLRIAVFFVLSFGLSAFFWLPALIEKNIILLSKIPIADRSTYFVTINQLLIPKWGYDLPDHPEGFSYQIGLAHIAVVCLVVGMFVLLWLKKEALYKGFMNRMAAVLSITAIVLILLMFSFTSFIWQITPLLKEINYPWTLLAPIGFLISLLAGFLWLQQKSLKIALLVLCCITIVLVAPHAKPSSYIDHSDAFYLTNDGTTTSSQELMPLWVEQIPLLKSTQKVEIKKGKGTIKDVVFNSKHLTATLDLKNQSLVRINTIYYPGWKILLDGKPVSISYTNINGVMEISAPAGNHRIEARFGETPLRLFSDSITVISFVLLVFLWITKKRIL